LTTGAVGAVGAGAAATGFAAALSFATR
jgi:hypothetical protein